MRHGSAVAYFGRPSGKKIYTQGVFEVKGKKSKAIKYGPQITDSVQEFMNRIGILIISSRIYIEYAHGKLLAEH